MDLAPVNLFTHALTASAIDSLTLGMMTRTSLGHTGRPLHTGRLEVFCYAAIQFAALTRVFLLLVFSSLYLQALVGSDPLSPAAFGVFTIRYWPFLSRPRMDRKPG
jgi:uncharacterized protein involved in response to NO